MILLDTHIWHWWVNQIPRKLTHATIKLIEESTEVGVSAISCFEGVKAVALPEHHKDPQDRIIIATALQYKANLISFDTQFPLYQELDGCLINKNL
ncbi:MAG: type II toxin-antitoxin system VapC family toxin [Candidatus Methylumidiphilus sp.]